VINLKILILHCQVPLHNCMICLVSAFVTVVRLKTVLEKKLILFLILKYMVVGFGKKRKLYRHLHCSISV